MFIVKFILNLLHINFMKKYLPLAWIILRFLVLYFILTALYQYYLNYYNQTLNTTDFFTDVMACQCKMILGLFGIQVDIIQEMGKHYVWLFFNNTYVASVNEGCNGVSVMILFVSFVLGFYKGYKKTFSFMFIGVLIIHVSNIIRGSFLSYIYFKYPEYKHITHDFVFPIIIYLVILALWFYWMKKVVLKENKGE